MALDFNPEAVSGLPAKTEIDYNGWQSPFDDSGVQFAWDSTSLGLLKTCPRKYQLSMVLNWQPKLRSHHLDFGIYFHSAIEHYLKLKATGSSFEDSVRSAVRKALVDSFGYAPPPGDNYKTRQNLIRTLVWYFEQYKNDNCKTIILSNGKPAVELSFRFEIGDGLMLSGHLDHLVQFGDDPTQRFVQDHKTTKATVTGGSAQFFFKNFQPDNQMTLYTIASQIAFHTPVKGVMIDAAQIAVNFSAFARGFTHRSKASLEEFLEGVHSYRRLAEHFTASGFWPMNETACGNYGGCAFRDICGKSPRVRESFLRTEFTQDKPWNPLEPR